MNEEEAVLATLDEYAEAYCAKDIDRLMGLFDEGEDISLIGTGADELCVGRSAIEDIFLRNFAEATATHFEWGWRQVHVNPESATVAISFNLKLNTDDGLTKIPIRWTVGMVKRDDKWRWLHRHASSAAATQEQGAAYPTANEDGE